MASRGVSTLKFVGTVSLGLLTGLSYTLSTLTVPSLLNLPSASSASRAFDYLISTAKTHLHSLTAVSASSFLLAYLLSPRAQRHPYLLYTTLLVTGSRLVTSDLVAPYLFITKSSSSSSPSASAAAARQRKKQEKKDQARMEASYEVLGASEIQADKTDSDESPSDEEAAQINGERVRTEVEGFLKKQTVQTAIAGLGFLMAVIGIWGDGAAQAFRSDVVVVKI